MTEHKISVLARNKPDVLARITGLFSAKGCSISSLAADQTEDPAVTRMQIVIRGLDEPGAERMRKHLRRLIDTISVS